VTEPDPVLRQLREQISATDRAILDAVNARLELVARIKEHKESHGIGFLDPAREQALLRELTEANGGPLSDQGVEELLRAILDLTKREVR
jgi:chorismate mutase